METKEARPRSALEKRLAYAQRSTGGASRFTASQRTASEPACPSGTKHGDKKLSAPTTVSVSDGSAETKSSGGNSADVPVPRLAGKRDTEVGLSGSRLKKRASLSSGTRMSLGAVPTSTSTWSKSSRAVSAGDTENLHVNGSSSLDAAGADAKLKGSLPRKRKSMGSLPGAPPGLSKPATPPRPIRSFNELKASEERLTLEKAALEERLTAMQAQTEESSKHYHEDIEALKAQVVAKDSELAQVMAMATQANTQVGSLQTRLEQAEQHANTLASSLEYAGVDPVSLQPFDGSLTAHENKRAIEERSAKIRNLQKSMSAHAGRAQKLMREATELQAFAEGVTHALKAKNEAKNEAKNGEAPIVYPRHTKVARYEVGISMCSPERLCKEAQIE